MKFLCIAFEKKSPKNSISVKMGVQNDKRRKVSTFFAKLQEQKNRRMTINNGFVPKEKRKFLVLKGDVALRENDSFLP